MIALAFDTSSTVLSIALQNNTAFYEETRIVGLNHSEKLLPLIDKLLDEASIEPHRLDVVICAKGPGSFTGLRIGMASAKGLAAGASCALVSVPTLDVFAFHPFLEYITVVPVIDARKNHFYSALYRKGERFTDYLDVTGEQLVKIISAHTPALITGPAASQFNDAADGTGISIDARGETGAGFSLLRLGVSYWEKGIFDERSAGPLYIRKSDAELMFGYKKNERE